MLVELPGDQHADGRNGSAPTIPQGEEHAEPDLLRISGEGNVAEAYGTASAATTQPAIRLWPQPAGDRRFAASR